MSELVDAWENVTDAMAAKLVDSWNVMAAQIGDRPMWNEQLPERQQCRQYQLVRNNPNAWTALMQEHGYKATTEYMQRGERLSRKYPDEVAYGVEAAMQPPMQSQPQPMMPPEGAPSVPVPTA